MKLAAAVKLRGLIPLYQTHGLDLFDETALQLIPRRSFFCRVELITDPPCKHELAGLFFS